ncbi:MAG: response regulator [Desulfobacterales bacterium]|nr:response regulator [Desulfobacterales bacterium]MCF8077946.1 response regulator [Desulfobacterales bacterium]
MGKQAMRLLIVDDENRFLETTEKLLAKKGYEAITAASGEEALEKLSVHPVHVVILDVKMPGMDGNQVLKEIKRRHPLVEVIMLTGHATVESAIDGLKAGAADYLMKPADINELVAKAEEAFSRRRQVEEKIRVAQIRHTTGSARRILDETGD